jgi:hypothetical protein
MLGRKRRLGLLLLFAFLLVVTYIASSSSKSASSPPRYSVNSGSTVPNNLHNKDSPSTTTNNDNGLAPNATRLAQLLNNKFPLQHDLLSTHMLEKRDRILKMCHNTYWRTLNSAVYNIDGRIFIKTGDIPEMWIRDSGAQVCFAHSCIFA